MVATANHYGRRLITVVLGMPSAKLRNQEAADLFDRGFAMGGGSGSLDALPSAEGGPPNMRTNVCLHRSAAAIAAEEEDAAEEQASTRSAGRGGGAIAAVAASAAPTRTVLSDERPEFDPVPVFIGPVAGWNGPVLGPRNASAVAEAPSAAKAYAGDQPDALKNASATGAPNATAGAAGRGADAAGAGRASLQASPEAGEALRNGQGFREDRAEIREDRGRKSRSGRAGAKAAGRAVTEPGEAAEPAVLRANRRAFPNLFGLKSDLSQMLRVMPCFGPDADKRLP